MKHFIYLLTSLLVLLPGCGSANQAGKSGSGKDGKAYIVGFYNLENLFDTYHDEGHNDYEYLPDGGNEWTDAKYAKKLFIHRNTLVYRLDKLQKSTNLDLRVFEDAITFHIALMVVEYMKYMEEQNY